MAKAAKKTTTTSTNVPAVVRNGPAPLKVGRPSLYDPSLCERVLEMGADGLSPAAMAAEFNVDRTTLIKWGDEHPEFFTALKRAKQLEQAWWEKAGRDGMYSDKFNAQVWRTSMQARFRDDYTERREQTVTGPEGGPVLVAQHKRIDIRLLEPEKREALRQLLIEARENATREEEG